MTPTTCPPGTTSNPGPHMLATLPVAELAASCRAETARYRRGEPCCEDYALELFRRAIVQHDDAAWAALYAEYADLVRQWLGTPPCEDDDGVVATFERFWRAMDAAKFERFSALGAVLSYLKLCAHTLRIDRARQVKARLSMESLESLAEVPCGDDVAEEVRWRVDAGAVWQVVQERVTDERERMVLYLSYVIGLSPRQICRWQAERFPDVAEIYRLKSRALARLRQAPALHGERPAKGSVLE